MSKPILLYSILIFLVLFIVSMNNYWQFSKRIYHSETGKDFDKGTAITLIVMHVVTLVSFSVLVTYILAYIRTPG